MFFCETCKKQYANVHQLEIHLSSYDHHHRKVCHSDERKRVTERCHSRMCTQRLMETKKLHVDAKATEKKRQRERDREERELAKLVKVAKTAANPAQGPSARPPTESAAERGTEEEEAEERCARKAGVSHLRCSRRLTDTSHTQLIQGQVRVWGTSTACSGPVAGCGWPRVHHVPLLLNLVVGLSAHRQVGDAAGEACVSQTARVAHGALLSFCQAG